MKRTLFALLFAAFLTTITLSFTGCVIEKKEGPGEKIGKGIDEISDALKDMSDKSEQENRERYGARYHDDWDRDDHYRDRDARDDHDLRYDDRDDKEDWGNDPYADPERERDEEYRRGRRY